MDPKIGKGGGEDGTCPIYTGKPSATPDSVHHGGAVPGVSGAGQRVTETRIVVGAVCAGQAVPVEVGGWRVDRHRGQPLSAALTSNTQQPSSTSSPNLPGLRCSCQRIAPDRSIEPERFIRLRLLQLAWQRCLQGFAVRHASGLQHSGLGLQALQFSIDKLQALQLLFGLCGEGVYVVGFVVDGDGWHDCMFVGNAKNPTAL